MKRRAISRLSNDTQFDSLSGGSAGGEGVKVGESTGGGGTPSTLSRPHARTPPHWRGTPHIQRRGISRLFNDTQVDSLAEGSAGEEGVKVGESTGGGGHPFQLVEPSRPHPAPLERGAPHIT